MKVGDLVGVAGTGSRHVSLYCEVTSVHPTHIKLWVINGHWNLNLYNNGVGEVMSPTTIHTTPMALVFIGCIPSEYRENYNDAIQYMDEYLAQEGWFDRTLTTTRIIFDNQLRRISMFAAAVAIGWDAFRTKLDNKPSSKSRTNKEFVDEFDDDIPF